MKFGNTEAQFQPITITLETPAEARVFYQLGNYSSPISNVIKDTASLHALSRGEINTIIMSLFRNLKRDY
jgi:hypothetical protein